MAGIVVLGAGGMGREAAAWLLDTVDDDEVMGLLDDDPALLGTTVAGLPVLGGHEWLDTGGEVEVVVAIGDPVTRRHAADRVVAAGATLRTVVHPTAHLGPGVSIGSGCIVCPGVVVSRDVRLGRCVIVNYGAAIGHDTVVGHHAFVGPGAHVAGNVTIGDEAEIGIGASVVQGRRIGVAARVGAGAAVVRDVGDGVVAVGVPARPRAPSTGGPTP